MAAYDEKPVLDLIDELVDEAAKKAEPRTRRAKTLESILPDVRESENGTQQPARVKRRLRELERAGLLRWVQTPGCRSSGGGGWYFTEEGRAALAAEKAKVR